jgi:hypothetical protein
MAALSVLFKMPVVVFGLAAEFGQAAALIWFDLPGRLLGCASLLRSETPAILQGQGINRSLRASYLTDAARKFV